MNTCQFGTQTYIPEQCLYNLVAISKNSKVISN